MQTPNFPFNSDSATDSTIDIRCPSCNKLLGKRLSNWAVEARHGRNVTAIIRRGALVCDSCGQSVPIDTD